MGKTSVKNKSCLKRLDPALNASLMDQLMREAVLWQCNGIWLYLETCDGNWLYLETLGSGGGQCQAPVHLSAERQIFLRNPCICIQSFIFEGQAWVWLQAFHVLMYMRGHCSAHSSDNSFWWDSVLLLLWKHETCSFFIQHI